MKDITIENQVELREIVDFKVDSSACVKCGACVRDCAFKVLSVDDNSLPAMPHPEKCMRCQHCFAICPTGAITFDGVKSSDAMEVKGLSLPNAEQVSNWIKSRRSIRKFLPEDVDPAVLDKVLKLLANSPTGCNARSLTFTCYPNRAAVDEFRSAFLKAVEEHRDGAKLLPRWLAIPAIKLRKGGDDIFFRGASGILIVSSDETASGVTTPMEDVTIACSNFELIANANGIGTCWCGFLKLVQNEIPELLEKAAGIRRTTPFYAILFGKSAVKYARCAERGAYASIVYKHPKGSD
jgi:nitroreductase/NAD-dependent dihydropyrimidine dehydrogenase PreA subunit